MKGTGDHVVTDGYLRRTTVIMLVIEGLAMFVSLLVLGSAIDGPASLDRPPALVLPAIADNLGAVRLGYVAYLAYSHAFWPLADRWNTATEAASATESIEVAYETLNSFGGAIGEVLGVGLFTGIWIAAASLTILRTRALPAWTGRLGLLASSGTVRVAA